MSRYANLIQYLKSTYSFSREGHAQLRKRRFATMLTIAKDLQIAGRMPIHWRGMTADCVIDLVEYWREQGLSSATQMNKLSVLRHCLQFFGNQHAIPSNKSLGVLKDAKKTSEVTSSQISFDKIEGDIPKVLWGFENAFGLTKKETAQLIPDINFRESNLVIRRNIAFNHKERFIPVITEHQKMLIPLLNNLVSDQQCLLDLFSYKSMLKSYRQAMKQFQVSCQKINRKNYVISRYAQLNAFGSGEAINVIRAELGVTSGQIRRYLNEQPKI